MATVRYVFNPILSAECEGSVTPSWTTSNSLGAQEDTQTSFNFIEVYIGSYLSLRFLSSLFPYVEIEWKEKLELTFSHFQYFNLQIIRTWPQTDVG